MSPHKVQKASCHYYLIIVHISVVCLLSKGIQNIEQMFEKHLADVFIFVIHSSDYTLSLYYFFQSNFITKLLTNYAAIFLIFYNEKNASPKYFHTNKITVLS